MQNSHHSRARRPQFGSRAGGSSPGVTAAVGMEETAGRSRARHNSLFTRTIIWATGLICLAFLLAALAQAWSNSSLMGQVQMAQQHLQALQQHNAHLSQVANHYKDSSVIESEARQQLGYVRPGEHPVVIISSTDPNQRNTPAKTSKPPFQGFWQAWLNVFFGS